MFNLKFILNIFKYWFYGKKPVFEIYMRDRKVLDLGCGEGEILKLNPEMIYGIDINKDRVADLKKDGYNAVVGSIDALPFESESFDVVHASNLIEHLMPTDARNMVAEAFRVLRRGGRFVIITPMPKTVWNTFGHVKPYPPEALKKLFRQVSLESFNSVSGAEIKDVMYYGMCTKNKFFFLLTTILANIAPNFWAGSYLAVIEKKN